MHQKSFPEASWTAANEISLEGVVKQTRLRLLMVGFLFLPLLARSEVCAQEKIRIGFSTYSPGFLPTVIAEKKGFYAKYGLFGTYSDRYIGRNECAGHW